MTTTPLPPTKHDHPDVHTMIWTQSEPVWIQNRDAQWQAYAQQPQADTPQATTIAEAARDVGKWLNERPNRPIDLRHVAMLVAHAMQPQAEAVPLSPQVMVDMVPPATARDRWMYEQGRLAERDPRTHAAPQQAEAVPSDVVRDAVAAEREACAALAQGYAGQVGDVAWAVAAAIRGRGNAANAQQKGGV